jgi:hypothetical protein
MKPHDPDRRQGKGKVEGAARRAKAYVERDPEGAARAEAKARRGPRSRGTRASVDELVAKSRTVADHVRRVVARVRARLRRK